MIVYLYSMYGWMYVCMLVCEEFSIVDPQSTTMGKKQKQNRKATSKATTTAEEPINIYIYMYI